MFGKRKRWMSAALAACLGGWAANGFAQGPALPVPPEVRAPGSLTAFHPGTVVPGSPAPVANAPGPPATAAPSKLPANLPGDIPLTQDDLLVLAEQNHPVLSVARSRIDSAQGRLVQAGLYPNPIMTPRVDELNNTLGRGGKPGVTFAQEIVLYHKLKISREAARHGVDAADAQALTDYYDLRARVRMAYVELLTAASEVEVNQAVAGITEQALAAAKKLEKAGTATRPDVVRAEVEREQSLIRLAVSQRRLEAAERLLTAAVGMPKLPAGPNGPLVVGRLDIPTPVLSWDVLQQTMLSRSSELLQANAVVALAEGLLRRAEADACPNITVSYRPVINTIDKCYEQLIEISAPIPIWNRNQGNIQAARAEVARAQADVHQVELRLTERLTAAYQRYSAAQRQQTAYRERIVPGAEEALKLVGTGYEKGDPKYDFTTFLQAEQTLAQARLGAVTARGDAWRALAEIRALVQDEGPGEGCPVPAAR
jgi:cobalt-zinc-cadmium efflux system outer membrane protein